MTNSNLIWIPLLPLLGALINLTVGRRMPRGFVHYVAVLSVAASFFTVLFTVFGPLLAQWRGRQILEGTDSPAELVQHVYTWIQVGAFKVDFALRLDTLAAVMCLVVTGVGTLIHIYSTGYMAEEPRYAAYFGYLNLFTGAMLILVLAANMPVMFIGWEGVGVCSYLLIGFWFTRTDYADAGRKAFVVNRIGDFAFLLGMFLLWQATMPLQGNGSSLDFALFRDPAAGEAMRVAFWGGERLAAAAGILLFIGACGKSAQIPLYVWLPDAMAGPTPVSALIHAATMVTAGVYMIARLSFLYAHSTTAMAVVAGIGCLTAILAAFMAFAQTDLKKVLAYSTVSQLGFMFVGVGTGNWIPAIFHLATHAFFKAGLFLGAGSVMHAMSGSGDIMKMGGLRRRLPWTHATFLVYCLAIAGFPLMSGYFSKDEILAGAWGAHHDGWPVWYGRMLWVGLSLAAFGTAVYMWRLYFLVFSGECRADEETKAHIHESPPSMIVPLVVLAILSVGAGIVGLPHVIHIASLDWLIHGLEHWLDPAVEMQTLAHNPAQTIWMLLGVATVVGLGGIALAWYLYRNGPSRQVDKFVATETGHNLYEASRNKLWVDEIYEKAILAPYRWLARGLFEFVDRFVIDTVLVNGTAFVVSLFGRIARWVQNGQVQRYIVGIVIGAALLFLLTSRAQRSDVSYRRVPDGIELRADPGGGLLGRATTFRWDVDNDGRWDLKPEAIDHLAQQRARGIPDPVIDRSFYVSDPVIVRRPGEIAPYVRLEITDPVTRRARVIEARVRLDDVAPAPTGAAQGGN